MMEERRMTILQRTQPSALSPGLRSTLTPSSKSASIGVRISWEPIPTLGIVPNTIFRRRGRLIKR
jgi:hypothetical protein